jgi:hypothetical protein
LTRHKQWISPNIQNELLKILADQVLSNIIEDLILSSSFSVITDETMDISRDELYQQGSIYIRYISNGKIVESFIGFYLPKSTSGKDICDLVSSVLRAHGLNLKLIVGVGADGASNMSGQV